jgi:hypothetical protein|tara:strand:- start:283 stop:510 length:228 start_codon:yes stop_codon:yes gene_type:complete
MTIKDKIRMKEILKDYTNILVDRYYITNYPQITKSDNITQGYNDKQSIHFQFKTTKPSETEMDMMIQVFIETLMD